MFEAQQALFEDETPAAPSVLATFRRRVVPSYVYPSAVREWEQIAEQLSATGIPNRLLERATLKEFMRRDQARTVGGTFPRGEVRRG